MIIGFVNLKGGVGKSNLCQNIATAIGGKQDPVLIVDLDSNATSSHWFGRRQQNRHWSNLLPIDVQQPTGTLSPARARKLGKGYSHVMIDAPANDRDVATEAMSAAELIVVPLPPYPDDFDGTQQTIELYQALRRRRKKMGKVAIVVNRVRANERIARSILERIQGHWRDMTIRFVIGQRVEFPVASDKGKTVIETQKNGQAAKELRAVANELLGWLR